MKGIVGVIVGLLVAGLSTAAVGSAQEPAGTLYLTNAQVFYNAARSAVCDEVQYALATEAPTATEDSKAYLARSYAAAACFQDFRYTFTQDTVLQGEAAVQLWFACDVAGVGPAADGVASNARVRVFKNDETANFGARSLVLDHVCTSTPTELAASLALTETEFMAGDLLRLEVTIWYGPSTSPPDPVKNLHVRVMGVDRPSRITAPGLPRAAATTAPSMPEAFVISAPEVAATAEPGGAAAYALTIENQGEAEAQFTVSVTGLPEGFAAEFSSSEGTVAASNTTSVDLSVAVPIDAAPGPYPFDVVAAGPGGGNATITLTVEVVDEGSQPEPQPGGSAPSSGEPTGDEEASSTNNETGGAAEGREEGPESDNGIPGVESLVLVTALGGYALGLRRRRAP